MPRMTSRLSPVQSVRLRQLAVTLPHSVAPGRCPVMPTLYQGTMFPERVAFSRCSSAERRRSPAAYRARPARQDRPY